MGRKGNQTPMTRVFVARDVTFNGLIYLDTLLDPRPGTIFSQRFNEMVGGTAAGKAFNLHPEIDLAPIETQIAACDIVALNLSNYFRRAVHHLSRPRWSRQNMKNITVVERFLCPLYRLFCVNVG